MSKRITEKNSFTAPVYSGKHIAADGKDAEKNKEEKLVNQDFINILKKGFHGISFSPYLEGQRPGMRVTREQIEKRIEIIKPYVRWIRSFSSGDGNELIPEIAHEHGLKVLAGAWLGPDEESNEREMRNAVNLAKRGHADILAIGNEVLLRGDMEVDELIKMIQKVKYEALDIPVGCVDAYFEFIEHPRLIEVCDVLLVNCYPFWEGYSVEEALPAIKSMYAKTKNAAKNKKVIISETGWPDRGTAEKKAIPSQSNATKYFSDIFGWAEEEKTDIFYFTSFDETWKVEIEGDVGACWGLWDKNGNLKFG